MISLSFLVLPSHSLSISPSSSLAKLDIFLGQLSYSISGKICLVKWNFDKCREYANWLNINHFPTPTRLHSSISAAPVFPTIASFKYLSSPPCPQSRLHSIISAAPRVPSHYFIQVSQQSCRVPNPGFIQVSQQPPVSPTQAYNYLSSPQCPQPRLHSSISAAPVSPTQASFKYLSSLPCPRPLLQTSISAVPCVPNPAHRSIPSSPVFTYLSMLFMSFAEFIEFLICLKNSKTQIAIKHWSLYTPSQTIFLLPPSLPFSVQPPPPTNLLPPIERRHRYEIYINNQV